MSEETIPALIRDDQGLCKPVELYRDGDGTLMLATGDPLTDTGETTRVAGWHGIDHPTARPVYVTDAGLEVVVCGEVTR